VQISRSLLLSPSTNTAEIIFLRANYARSQTVTHMLGHIISWPNLILWLHAWQPNSMQIVFCQGARGSCVDECEKQFREYIKLKSLATDSLQTTLADLIKK
jgi:hypothetical protein